MHASKKNLKRLPLQSMCGITSTQSWDETSVIDRASIWQMEAIVCENTAHNIHL